MTIFEMRRRRPLKEPSRRVRRRGATRAFTREEIIDAIRRWVDEYGAPPTWLDWEPSRARRKGHVAKAERFEAGEWPSVRMVRRQFSTLTAAIDEAGFDAPPAPSFKANLVGPDEILRAIREWTLRHGDTPAQADWDPTRARLTGQPWRADRYETEDWPSLGTVRHHYGTLTAAIRAAGLEPATRHERRQDRGERRARNRVALIRHIGARQPSAGPEALAQLVRQVAWARGSSDPDQLERALLTLAGGAVRWADLVRSQPRSRHAA